MIQRLGASAFLLTALIGCRSVEVPREHYYRLEPAPAGTGDPGRGGVLRVHDLQLGTALDSDCLMVANGTRLEPRLLDHWVAPLDRLVTDALVLGLSRSRSCALVKGAADSGAETWSLHGRIVDFAESRTEAGAEANVALELWLEGSHGEVLFHDEFQAREPLHEAGPDAAVAALSHGLQSVVRSVVERMDANGLFAAARPAAPTSR